MVENRVEEHRKDGVVSEQAAAAPARCPLPKVARRVGAAAVVFFVVQGLLWLVVPAILMWLGR
ncbi:MAG TPA: hypothetical protein VHC70_13485 [Phycisphaerales bacterium]|nr:hypothetical protein [Phycisphaerales bacterium]